ncbi:hypothetical protein YJ57_20175 [Salmonella enterica subsp. enterica]|nr:hypothetical protein [Salmonella enterica subsp. enterica]EDV1533678.1 hypothetical protein [Salmonella enterica subsp. enterica]
MAKGTKHVLTVEAEVKEARRRLRELENDIGRLGEKSGKGVKVNLEEVNFGGIGEAISNMGLLGQTITRFAASPLGAIAAVKALGDHLTGMSKEMRTASNEVGLTVERLQKMQSTFSDTSLTVEKLGDMHKDLSEKMGAAILEGGGVSDMIKEAGLNFKELHGILMRGGDATDVLARVYYTMRASGKSIDEIRAVMEDLVSDGSKLIPTLENLGSETNYLNEKANKQVTITNEMAKKHEEYEKKTKQLGQTIDNLKVQKLTGLVDYLIQATGQMSKMAYDIERNRRLKDYVTPKLTGEALERQNELRKSLNRDSKFQNSLKNGTALVTASEHRSLLEHGFDSRQYNPNDPNNSVYRALQMLNAGINPNNLQKRNEFRFTVNGQTYDGNGTQVITINQPDKKADEAAGKDAKAKTCSKCKGKEHENGEKCPVDVAKENQRRAEQEQKRREDALKKLNALDVKLQGQTAASVASQNKMLEASLKDLDTALDMGLISQEEAAAKRQALIDQNAENVYKMLLGADPVDALNALGQLEAIRDAELASHKKLLDNKAITYEEYLRRVNDSEQNYSQIADAANGLGAYKSEQLGDSFGYVSSNSPFAQFDKIDDEKRKAEQDYNTQKLHLNNINDPTERHKQLERLNEAHQKKMRDIDKKYADARVGVAGDMYNGLSGLMSMFGAENSRAMQAAFKAYQAYQVGEATVSMFGAAQDAWAETKGGTGAKMAAAAVAVAQGMANIAKIKSTSIDGMAHDGIDNIPREGTWLLQKGERVVDDRTNGDLKDFLSAQKSGNGNGAAPIEVNAPLHINGNVNSADKMVMDAIKRHAQFVAQAVEDAQRRKM